MVTGAEAAEARRRLQGGLDGGEAARVREIKERMVAAGLPV